jgi:hypothetical protein
MLMVIGVGTFIINFSGPASPQRHDPGSPGRHTLSCTPFPEEPHFLRASGITCASCTFLTIQRSSAPFFAPVVEFAPTTGIDEGLFPGLVQRD